MGSKTGIVLESGDQLSQLIAVYDGYKLTSVCDEIEFGAKDV
jgi:hypothetical protein